MKKECCIKTIKQIEEWFKERTHIRKGFPNRVIFMPFEWVELKSELIGKKENKNHKPLPTEKEAGFTPIDDLFLAEAPDSPSGELGIIIRKKGADLYGKR